MQVKTGTAEVDFRHPNHGLFIGYAPASDPEYAVAIRIANGYSSGNACLIANDIFKYMSILQIKILFSQVLLLQIPVIHRMTKNDFAAVHSLISSTGYACRECSGRHIHKRNTRILEHFV